MSSLAYAFKPSNELVDASVIATHMFSLLTYPVPDRTKLAESIISYQEKPVGRNIYVT